LIIWFVFLLFLFWLVPSWLEEEWRPAESLRHVSLPPYRSDSSPSSLLCAVLRDPVFISACKWGKKKKGSASSGTTFAGFKKISPPPRVDRR
jgi:hypothetical protein